MGKLLRRGIAVFLAGITVMNGAVTGENVWAAEGRIYSATLERSYRNPYTGEVEDSGGEEGFATGQGMVESAAYPNALIEKMSDGTCYMTLKIGLADFATDHYFEVGTGGEFSEAEAFIAGEGSDSNGSTLDVCVKMPSENAVIRGSMFVEPMGRDVVFFLKPGNPVPGNSTDFTPQYVLEEIAEVPETKTQEPVKKENPNKEEPKEKSETEENSVKVEAPVPAEVKVTEKKGLTLSTEKDFKTAKKEAPKKEKKAFGFGGIAAALIIGGGIGFAVSRRKGGADDEE